jgi:plastocyanin
VRQRDRMSIVPALPLLIVMAMLAPWRATPHASQTRTPMPMNDAAMKERADRWWATHPRVGKQSTAAATVTVNVVNYQFNADGNPLTPVDTVKIHVGDTVMWQWVQGTHTVTNGTGSLDPSSGTIFNVPLDSTDPTFSYQFGTPGLYPYYCVIHEGTMAGYVQVQTAAGVGPAPASGARLGFTRDPHPNPARRGVSFSFALPRAGRARVEVFDADGRRVAIPVDLELGAGAHEEAWDGRQADGGFARSGIYYLRLTLPGCRQSRRVTLTR